jgi:hypothetical protein
LRLLVRNEDGVVHGLVLPNMARIRNTTSRPGSSTYSR